MPFSSSITCFCNRSRCFLLAFVDSSKSTCLHTLSGSFNRSFINSETDLSISSAGKGIAGQIVECFCHSYRRTSNNTFAFHLSFYLYQTSSMVLCLNKRRKMYGILLSQIVDLIDCLKIFGCFLMKFLLLYVFGLSYTHFCQ